MEGELLDGLTDVRGEELVNEHELGYAEVLVAVIAGSWWRLPGAARSDNRPRGGGGERHAGRRWWRWGHSVSRRCGGGGGGKTRGCGRSLVLWRRRGCGVAPLRCSGGGESHRGSRSRGARRGAGGRWLSGAWPYVGGERLVLAFSRRHLRGGRAPLGLEVAEATPEVGVGAVEGGVRCRTCLVVFDRRRSCEGEAGLHILEGNGANPGSEGGLHAGPDLLEAPEVGGRSARVTQKGPR